ncbi:hypothetical protein E4U09_007928 [Claviceps aff. purpurea]|uniref:AMP-dependent synthetase/ligase domain-containing protein n=1 Tax=Claviceps aff. purpurea TaxID=1967640 RepID=A0A9P7TYT5_9HYPO|nr:hypothetical protein E4U09_007928 [Claviceps aff. purpurea]
MGLLETIDSSITDLFSQWNAYSTALATALVLIITYRIMSATEPDIHPLLLARQSIPSAVRHEGESAIYRSQSAPHGMPLNAGLNIKDAGVPKFSRGRDGDLRDIWRKAATGGDTGATGRLLTVLGSENVIEHKIEADINRQINIIGRYLEGQGSIKVAIYLPNSIELLITLFACSFYPNLTTVILPFNVAEPELINVLRRSAVDTVVTASGSFPLDSVVKAYSLIRQLIWVVDDGSRHMDWNNVPEGTGGSVNVTTWQDLVNDTPGSTLTELPPVDKDQVPQDIVTFWQDKASNIGEMVLFSQANLASAVSSQLVAIPSRERLTQTDLFLPVDPLSNIHTLTLTLAALFSNASVALNSVAGQSADLALATQGVSPTVVVASPAALLRSHEESIRKLSSGLAKLSHTLSTKTLTQRGVHAASNALSGFAAGSRLRVGTTPGKLRLVCTAERIGAHTPLLSCQVLSDLRVLSGARIIYALSAARVAGSVTQTAVFDYRVSADVETHFGAPTTSVEIYMKDLGSHKTTDDVVEGEIIVRGPCVSGGEARLGVSGRLNDDNTLSYA